MAKNKTASIIYGALTIVFLAMIVWGSIFSKEAPPKKDFSQMVAVSVVGYNHIEDQSISRFLVNGASGASLGPYHGGSGFMCCISIPLHWRAGLQATVYWSYGGDPEGAPFQTSTVEIPEYTPENMGSLQVHFYPNHRVIVISSRYGLRHPWNPLLPGDRAPWIVDEAVVRNLEWSLEQQKKTGEVGRK